jgi:hypothetical protein
VPESQSSGKVPPPYVARWSHHRHRAVRMIAWFSESRAQPRIGRMSQPRKAGTFGVERELFHCFREFLIRPQLPIPSKHSRNGNQMANAPTGRRGNLRDAVGLRLAAEDLTAGLVRFGWSRPVHVIRWSETGRDEDATGRVPPRAGCCRRRASRRSPPAPTG